MAGQQQQSVIEGRPHAFQFALGKFSWVQCLVIQSKSGLNRVQPKSNNHSRRDVPFANIIRQCSSAAKSSNNIIIVQEICHNTFPCLSLFLPLDWWQNSKSVSRSLGRFEDCRPKTGSDILRYLRCTVCANAWHECVVCPLLSCFGPVPLTST